MGKRKDYLETNVVREITFSTFRKTHLLRDRECAQYVEQSLFEAKRKYGFQLFSYVVMSNHVHFLVMLNEPTPISSILSSIKGSSGKQILKHLRSTNPGLLNEVAIVRDEKVRHRIWLPGGGYDRSLRDDQSIENAIDYIHNNPVKAGLVNTANEYAFSSAKEFFEGDFSRIDPMPRLSRFG
ncbi:MAG: transposase [Fimbriimonadaceae bacterium]|nr:MAG: transposase [Fimbriimonadaceae bacterium]